MNDTREIINNFPINQVFTPEDVSEQLEHQKNSIRSALYRLSKDEEVDICSIDHYSYRTPNYYLRPVSATNKDFSLKKRLGLKISSLEVDLCSYYEDLTTDPEKRKHEQELKETYHVNKIIENCWKEFSPKITTAISEEGYVLIKSLHSEITKYLKEQEFDIKSRFVDKRAIRFNPYSNSAYNIADKIIATLPLQMAQYNGSNYALYHPFLIRKIQRKII